MFIKRLFEHFRRLNAFAMPDGGGISMLFPIGHYYSPIANTPDIRARQDKIWVETDSMLGIDLQVEAQVALARELAPYTTNIDWPVAQPNDPARYFYNNDQFPLPDAEFLYAALQHFRPKKLIEVGSGFSSLVTAEVNRTHFNNAIEFSCIEPYPRQFLIDGVDGISQLVRQRVEEVETGFFDRLDAGDILFIDSSHVSKVGSDVNYLFFEILPRLRPGVIVHIHDIFLPDEYPKNWMIDQGRNWNEQYLVRAFLQFNDHWKVVWSSHFMGTREPAVMASIFPRMPERIHHGSSLWFRRVS
ncbi:class I SAM-dependent methyltransferase [Herbaspirillum rhizosphaerae]|uniref:class I SAM-dependent methyltransferase n=1 Tax=Herbaspirillum rhizosphaerae TaxID=346179 RepID=UPI00067E35F0|nr:class I SAM-dependent methyltransferase [Herbaspirillum rhizosphaerae]